jgi:hypothetical protein
MDFLHILKSEPDDTTQTLMGILSDGKESIVFPLYKDDPDYGKLIDLIFEHDHDKVITWW